MPVSSSNNDTHVQLRGLHSCIFFLLPQNSRLKICPTFATTFHRSRPRIHHHTELTWPGALSAPYQNYSIVISSCCQLPLTYVEHQTRLRRIVFTIKRWKNTPVEADARSAHVSKSCLMFRRNRTDAARLKYGNGRRMSPRSPPIPKVPESLGYSEASSMRKRWR